MSKRFGSAAVAPQGFALERLDSTPSGTEVVIRGIGQTSVCPECGSGTAQVHSRYRRCPGDLPLAGRPVRLILMARGIRCAKATCGRAIGIDDWAWRRNHRYGTIMIVIKYASEPRLDADHPTNRVPSARRSSMLDFG